MHLYPWQIEPPDHSSIHALNTATPNLADVPPCQLNIHALNTTTPNLANVAHPQSIEHRCLEYHYTKLGRYRTMHIYTKGRWTPLSIEHTCLEYHYTKLGKCTPKSKEHRWL